MNDVMTTHRTTEPGCALPPTKSVKMMPLSTSMWNVSCLYTFLIFFLCWIRLHTLAQFSNLSLCADMAPQKFF